jgi:hypothetical protein
MQAWTAPVDLYCERFGPGLFAEPLNALSNLAFIGAGLWLMVALPRRLAGRSVPWMHELLAGLILLIGLGSAAFHTFATRWAEVLDMAFIGLFIHLFVVVYAHDVMDVRWTFAWLAAPAFMAFGIIVTGPFEPGDFNGSVGYFPALAGLLLMGAGLLAQRRPGAGWFLGSALVFAISLSLRSVDLDWCPRWPWGTHWAWHLLNALTLSLALLGLSAAYERRRVQA